MPLEGNRFDIDKSVSELTLLVFREGDVPVTLTPPGATGLGRGRGSSRVEAKGTHAERAVRGLGPGSSAS